MLQENPDSICIVTSSKLNTRRRLYSHVNRYYIAKNEEIIIVIHVMYDNKI